MPVEKQTDYYIYVPPTDKYGNKYWVPIVAKNKDVLYGFSEGVNLGLEMGETEVPYSPSMVLSSERLTDYTADGRRLYKMSKDELHEYIINLLQASIDNTESDHSDNGCIDIYDYMFHVSCQCGNFFGWEDAKDLPETDLHCEVCDRKVIEYIELSDKEMMYDGIDQTIMQETVQKIKEELGLE